MEILKSVLISILCVISCTQLAAQTGEQQHILVLKSGDTVTVKLLTSDDNSITIQNVKTGRKSRIAKSNIVSFEPLATPISSNKPPTKSKKERQNPADDDEYARIITKSNDTLIAKIVARDNVQMTVFNLKTLKNERIAVQDIVSIERAEIDRTTLPKDNINPSTSMQNIYAFSTRNIITPSAFPLKKGEGYYHNIGIFYNNFHYGITDNLSLGAGLVLLPISNFKLPIGAHLKYAGKVSDKWHMGVSLVIAKVPGDANAFATGGMGVATFGDRHRNLSFGFGMIHFDDTLIPFFNVSGQTQISGSLFFIGDLNIVIVDDNIIPLPIPGLRIKFKSTALDVSFGGIGFMAQFGNKNNG
jgi:hypothetical protein